MVTRQLFARKSQHPINSIDDSFSAKIREKYGLPRPYSFRPLTLVHLKKRGEDTSPHYPYFFRFFLQFRFFVSNYSAFTKLLPFISIGTENKVVQREPFILNWREERFNHYSLALQPFYHVETSPASNNEYPFPEPLFKSAYFSGQFLRRTTDHLYQLIRSTGEMAKVEWVLTNWRKVFTQLSHFRHQLHTGMWVVQPLLAHRFSGMSVFQQPSVSEAVREINLIQSLRHLMQNVISGGWPHSLAREQFVREQAVREQFRFRLMRDGMLEVLRFIAYRGDRYENQILLPQFTFRPLLREYRRLTQQLYSMVHRGYRAWPHVAPHLPLAKDTLLQLTFQPMLREYRMWAPAIWHRVLRREYGLETQVIGRPLAGRYSPMFREILQLAQQEPRTWLHFFIPVQQSSAREPHFNVHWIRDWQRIVERAHTWTVPQAKEWINQLNTWLWSLLLRPQHAAFAMWLYSNTDATRGVFPVIQRFSALSHRLSQERKKFFREELRVSRYTERLADLRLAEGLTRKEILASLSLLSGPLRMLYERLGLRQVSEDEQRGRGPLQSFIARVEHLFPHEAAIGERSFRSLPGNLVFFHIFQTKENNLERLRNFSQLTEKLFLRANRMLETWRVKLTNVLPGVPKDERTRDENAAVYPLVAGRYVQWPRAEAGLGENRFRYSMLPLSRKPEQPRTEEQQTIAFSFPRFTGQLVNMFERTISETAVFLTERRSLNEYGKVGVAPSLVIHRLSEIFSPLRLQSMLQQIIDIRRTESGRVEGFWERLNRVVFARLFLRKEGADSWWRLADGDELGLRQRPVSFSYLQPGSEKFFVHILELLKRVGLLPLGPLERQIEQLRTVSRLVLPIQMPFSRLERQIEQLRTVSRLMRPLQMSFGPLERQIEQFRLLVSFSPMLVSQRLLRHLVAPSLQERGWAGGFSKEYSTRWLAQTFLQPTDRDVLIRTDNIGREMFFRLQSAFFSTIYGTGEQRVSPAEWTAFERPLSRLIHFQEPRAVATGADFPPTGTSGMAPSLPPLDFYVPKQHVQEIEVVVDDKIRALQRELEQLKRQSQSQSQSLPDVDKLVKMVYQELLDILKLEQDRRGY